MFCDAAASFLLRGNSTDPFAADVVFLFHLEAKQKVNLGANTGAVGGITKNVMLLCCWVTTKIFLFSLFNSKMPQYTF